MARDLVLLHGWAMDRRVWEPVIPALGESCRMRNLCLPGYPGSNARAFASDDSMSGQVLLDWWSDQCLAAAPARAVWLGWSLGAMIAMNAVLRSRDAVRALVLVAPTPKFVAADDWVAGVAADVLGELLDGVRAGDGGILRRFILMQARGGARATAGVLGECLAHAPAPVLEAGLKVLAEVDLRPRLGELDLPVLVIHGNADRVVPKAAGGWIAEHVPHGELAPVSTGHAPFVDRPRQFADQVLGWI